MRKFGSFMFGAMLGGIIGSTLAILLAPASGDEMRQRIEDYFKHIQEEVNRAADEKRAELEMQLNRLRSGENIPIEEKTGK
jgi:gas vesicle protein